MAIVTEKLPKYIFKTEKDMIEPFCRKALSTKYCLAFKEVQYMPNYVFESSIKPEGRKQIDILIMDPDARILIAYELKLKDYRKVLKQAICNLEHFSHYSAFVMPEPVLKKHFSKIKAECKYLNIGAYGLTTTGELIPFNRINYRKKNGEPFPVDDLAWYIKKMPIYQRFPYSMMSYERRFLWGDSLL